MSRVPEHPASGDPPLVLHVVHALRMGGLENGLVNIINRTPAHRYRHAIACLTDYDAFAERIKSPDVSVHALHKRPGHDLRAYRRLHRLMRDLGPAIVHTRNFGTFDTQACSLLAGVPRRVHGEHGRDVFDLHLDNKRQLLVRRALRDVVHHYVALSTDLAEYLELKVGVRPARLSQICNGVDTERFVPRDGPAVWPEAAGFGRDVTVIGSVGRLEAVKDPLNLARSFNRLVALNPAAREHVRLAVVGGGTLAAEVEQELEAGGTRDLAWLAGARDDVPDLLRAMDVFALPSAAEGISNTVLEAMACGVPVVATAVGGNPELIAEGVTGVTVRAGDGEALASALMRYVDDAGRRRAHGRAGRERAVSKFSLDGMVARYLELYDELLGAERCRENGAVSSV